MKKLHVSTFQIITACLLLMSIFVTSCKEEEVDDPNIVYKSINKSVTSVIANVYAIDSIDLNGDSHDDFFMLVGANITADTAVVYLVANSSGVYIDSTPVSGSSTYKSKNLFTNQKPDTLSSKKEWATNAYIALRRGTDKIGYAGVGDVFIPIFFTKVGPPKYYGWLRVNVSSDYRTFKVIDGAYHIQADTPIKMGAK